MGDAGSPYALFKRCLQIRDMTMIESAIADMPAPLPLVHATAVWTLMCEQEDDRVDRAGVRLVGRLALEHPRVTVEDLVTLTTAMRDRDLDLVEELVTAYTSPGYRRAPL